MESRFAVPSPRNELVLNYAPGSPERALLEAELKRQANELVLINPIIDGGDYPTDRGCKVTMPCAHGTLLAEASLATPEVVQLAIERTTWQARSNEWPTMPLRERAAIFLRAADLLAGPAWRERLNAATMLGQGKTAYQAEIDAACELIDFWRWNVYFAMQIQEMQPDSAPGTWNMMDHRPLDGFVVAVTPFNFTSIALNLPTAPVLMGNTVIWKPSNTQLLSAWYGYKLLEEAGLPPGVINFLPGDGLDVGDIVLRDPMLAGVHFTGSTRTFQQMWRMIGENIANYATYPRLVGETGGKDFILAHPSADVTALAVAIVRGGYEYQGQKCSAAGRIYAPKSLWGKLKDLLVAMISEIKMGDVRDFSNFMGAVIDERAFTKHLGYLQYAHANGTVLCGGRADSSVGWYVLPTLVQVNDPADRLMCEEMFGPIVPVFVYDDADWHGVLEIVDATSPYALTGSVFAQDRYAINQALIALNYETLQA